MIAEQAAPYLKANGMDIGADWMKTHGPEIFASAEFRVGSIALQGQAESQRMAPGADCPGRARPRQARMPAERGRSPKWAMALDGLSATDRRTILDRLRSETLAARSIIFRQGAPSDRLVVLQAGRARLLQTHENGQEFTFGVFVGGTILGLAAVLLGRPHIVTAEAIDAVTISSLARSDFIRCTQSIPGFLRNITRLLALLSVESIERSGPMVLDDACVRLAAILLHLARQGIGKPDASPLSIRGLTQEDLAKMAGVSRTWVGATLADFERLGLLTKCRAAIAIENPVRLETFIASERNRRSPI